MSAALPTAAIWVYLSSQPLFWLTATLAAYVVADRLSIICRRHPIANPVLMATIMLGLVLRVTGTSYDRFFDGAQFVHFLLGRRRWRSPSRSTAISAGSTAPLCR